MQRREIVGGRDRRKRAVGCAAIRREHVERREIGLLRQTQIEIIELRQRRNRDIVLAAFVGFAVIVTDDRRQRPGGGAIPSANLAKKCHEFAWTLNLLSGGPNEHPAR